MCLTTVTGTDNVLIERKGFKVVTKDYKPLFQKTTSFKANGEWEKAVKTSLFSMDWPHHKYDSGFHLFETKEQAVRYMTGMRTAIAVPVLYKGYVTYGAQGTIDGCIVAEYIKFIKPRVGYILQLRCAPLPKNVWLSGVERPFRIFSTEPTPSPSMDVIMIEYWDKETIRCL